MNLSLTADAWTQPNLPNLLLSPIAPVDENYLLKMSLEKDTTSQAIERLSYESILDNAQLISFYTRFRLVLKSVQRVPDATYGLLYSSIWFTLEYTNNNCNRY